MRERHHSFHRVMTGLLAICLSACLVLMVGVSYARYQQDFAPVDYSWTAEEETGLILGGVVTQSWLDAGSWPENPNCRVGKPMPGWSSVSATGVAIRHTRRRTRHTRCSCWPD